MIIGIESSDTQITDELIKAKLLQDVLYDTNKGIEESAFHTKKFNKNYNKVNNNSNTFNNYYKKPRCYNCNKFKHLLRNCRSKRKSWEQGNVAQQGGDNYKSDDDDDDYVLHRKFG